MIVKPVHYYNTCTFVQTPQATQVAHALSIWCVGANSTRLTSQDLTDRIYDGFP